MPCVMARATPRACRARHSFGPPFDQRVVAHSGLGADNRRNTNAVPREDEAMSDKVYNVPAEWASRAFIDNEKYLAMYKRSVEDPNRFWGEIGKRIDWIKPYTKVKNTSYAPDNVSIKWYEDGTLNVCANCIDRHLKTRADQVAIIWEGDDPTHGREDHLSPAARAGVQVRQRAEGQRRQEGRPRHHLPADDPRGGLRHARLRPHRRGAFGGVRRLLARQPRRAHRRLPTPSSSSRPTRACAAAGRSRSRRTPTRR